MSFEQQGFREQRGASRARAGGESAAEWNLGAFLLPPGYLEHDGIQLKRDPALAALSLGLPAGYLQEYGLLRKEQPGGGEISDGAGALIARAGSAGGDALPPASRGSFSGL